MPENNQATNKPLSTPPTNGGEMKPTVYQIVERYLTEVEWSGTGDKGRCKCPGHHKHTVKSHRNDCWIFVNSVPTVSCLHNSCENDVAEANSKIRTAWSLFQPEVDPKVLQAAKEKAAARYALEEKAKASLSEILKRYKWDVQDILRDGLSPKQEDASSIFLTSMFHNPRDVVWVGEPETSGTEAYAAHFKMRGDWASGFYQDKNLTELHYTCASTFKPGTYSRANANVLKTPYLIVEGDAVLGKPESDEQKQINKNACGAIFRWLSDGLGLSLRAVVDSGNKSLHGWFTMPAPARFEELRVVLPALGCDKSMFKPTQPARLPGVVRDNGNEQKLLWIK